MAEEEISPASEGGAAVEGEQKAAELNPQGSEQGQSNESANKVDSGESQASSTKGPARSNYNWANQRTLEKAITKILSSSLDSRVKPLEESLKSLLERLTPPPGQEAQKGEIDYNDLPGSINKIVETLLKQREDIATKKLSELKSELLMDISTQTSKQEAMKYLQSQKDIGSDTSKHEEIQDIIVNDKILYHSLPDYPVDVMQEAVKRWRESKKNPMAPGKDELSTVTGGMGAARRGEGLSSQRIKELTDKAAGQLNSEDREKLNSEVEKLVTSMK